jgi:transcriptional regulator with XRE-family HTH domain
MNQMGENAKNLKQHLRDLIDQDKDLRQKEIARQVGISMGYLSQVLHDKRRGSYDLIKKIAVACGTSIIEIEKRMGDQAETQDKDKAPVVANIGHEEIITRFKDKEKARQINSMLVDIEAADSKDYEFICDMIKTMHGKVTLQKRAGPDEDRAVGES